jgi:hypothetical protein
VGLEIFALSATLKTEVKKVDLMEMQSGDVPANKGVTGTLVTLEMEITRAYLELLEQMIQGFKVNYDTTGSVLGYSQGDALGELDSSILHQVRMTAIEGQGPSTDPNDTIEIWKVASSANAEWKFDAASQRVYKAVCQCYKDTTRLDGSGRPTFFQSGDITAVS